MPIFWDAKHYQKFRYLKIKMLDQNSVSIECSNVFITLKFRIFDVIGIAQQCPSVYLKLTFFQILDLIDFGTWTL